MSQRCLLLVCLMLSLACAGARAQGHSTFSKGADVNVWAGFVSTGSDHNSGYDKGVAAGADFAMYFRLPVYPVLEARTNLRNGPLENFKSYDAGLRIETVPFFHHLRAYGNFLGGFGTAHYVNCNGGYAAPVLSPGLGPGCSIRGDNSPVYSPGGGVEYGVGHSFRVMADLQYELWNFGHNQTIHPYNATVGVDYRIPFREHTRYADYH